MREVLEGLWMCAQGKKGILNTQGVEISAEMERLCAV